MTYKESIQQLEVGDRVAICKGWDLAQTGLYKIETVEKVTATQITIGGVRYNKNSGIKIGDADNRHAQGLAREGGGVYWGRLMSLEEAERLNQERAAEIRIGKMANEIKSVSRVNLMELGEEKLQRIMELMGIAQGEGE